MRDKLDNPLPETTQAPPVSPIFDPRYWVPLTRAFGQFMSIIEARDHALICINRYVQEGQLRLLLEAPDGTTWEPDASERQKLTVHAPHNFEEGVRIEPYHEGRWYVCRCDLAKLTTIPATPAARAEAGLAPAGAPPAEPASSGSPLTEPPRSPQSPQAEPVSPGTETGQEESPPPGKQPDELTVADPTPGPEMRSHNLARPPSDKELNGFVAGFIKNTTDAGRIPTKKGLYQAARDALPGATRKRLFAELELQAETLPPGRPRKNRR
jgi:hypothetical protein